MEGQESPTSDVLDTSGRGRHPDNAGKESEHDEVTGRHVTHREVYREYPSRYGQNRSCTCKPGAVR